MRWTRPPLDGAKGSRREILALNVLTSLTSLLAPPQPALARTTPLVGDSADQPPAVVMPLYRCNGAFCAYYTVDDQRFRAVVDTGSPFLMVDGRCGPAPTPYCFAAPVRSVGMDDVSEEGYGGQVVRVEWRRGQVSFGGRPPGTPGAAASSQSGRELGKQPRARRTSDWGIEPRPNPTLTLALALALSR